MSIPNLTSQTYVDNALAGKLDLAGGTMTGAITLSASGIIFSDATYLTTAPAGSTLAADQLTAGVVTANPVAGPTSAGDVLMFDGTALIWAPGGGGGSVAWGGITGTVTDQTDLVTYLSGNYYPLSSNPAGYLTSVPGKTVYEVTSATYTLASTDANNVVYIPGSASGGFPPINITVPDDATYSFPVGTVITLSVDNSSSGSDINLIQGDPMAPAPTLIGTLTISSSTSGNFLLTKVAANRWICS